MEKVIFERGGVGIHCYLWDDVKSPKGVIQLIHGMTSYALRYDEFAKELNDKGYIVFGDDHRGHGHTERDGKVLGGLTEFDDTVEDELAITKMLKEKYKLPVQIFGHSYGSFITQRYIQHEDAEASGVLLSGSAYMGGKKLVFGKLLTAITTRFLGENKPDKLLYAITFASNNKAFAEEGTDNAWLSRNVDSVKAYNADPMANFMPPSSFYYSMMRGIYRAYLKENLIKIKKDLPIFIMSGDRDPVGGNGQKVAKLFSLYKSLGLNVVGMKLYPGARHELTNDPEKETVIADIVSFFDKNIERLSEK
ncbi:MAG TPA: alpha/beta hydrolase [Eubacteriales bacterium]|jgi:alpha-beta hydrolase superfamily lysophospholipase|nr:alpha/beta hydrolase [Eubacteriales bacterium]HRU83928.1 alpha/beta hydrolase [Eubacteriales bacterium]